MGQPKNAFFLAHDSHDVAAEFQKCLFDLTANAILHYTNEKPQFLSSVRQHVPDIIFMDTHIGGLSSTQLLTSLKCDSNLKNIPIVIYSTPKSSDELREYYSLGAERYFEQPVNNSGLIFGLEIILYLFQKNQLIRPEFEQFLISTNYQYFGFPQKTRTA